MLSWHAITFEIISRCAAWCHAVGRQIHHCCQHDELGPGDVFTSGMVALTYAVDNGEVLMEHLYPANPEALPLDETDAQCRIGNQAGTHTRHFCGDSRGAIWLMAAS